MISTELLERKTILLTWKAVSERSSIKKRLTIICVQFMY